MNKIIRTAAAVCAAFAVFVLCGCGLVKGGAPVKRTADELCDGAISLLGEKTASETYINLYVPSIGDGIKAVVDELRAEKRSSPAAVYVIDIDTDALASEYGKTGELSEKLGKEIERMSYISFSSAVNSRGGSYVVAATSAFQGSALGWCPSQTEAEMRLYVYEDAHPCAVTVFPLDDGIVSVNAQILYAPVFASSGKEGVEEYFKEFNSFVRSVTKIK